MTCWTKKQAYPVLLPLKVGQDNLINTICLSSSVHVKNAWSNLTDDIISHTVLFLPLHVYYVGCLHAPFYPIFHCSAYKLHIWSRVCCIVGLFWKNLVICSDLGCMSYQRHQGKSCKVLYLFISRGDVESARVQCYDRNWKFNTAKATECYSYDSSDSGWQYVNIFLSLQIL